MEDGVTTTSLPPRCCFSVSHIGFTTIIYVLLSFVVLFITSFSLNRFDEVWLFLVCHSEFLFNSLVLLTFFVLCQSYTLFFQITFNSMVAFFYMILLKFELFIDFKFLIQFNVMLFDFCSAENQIQALSKLGRPLIYILSLNFNFSKYLPYPH